MVGTERIETTLLGSVYNADGFALKGLTPIIQFISYDSEHTFLPAEIFRRFGGEVREDKGKVIVSALGRHKRVESFLKSKGQIYLLAKLLKELFPDKVLDVTTKEGIVKIKVKSKELLKHFNDLREEIPLYKELSYKTKYHLFLDRREWQFGVRVGIVVFVIAFILFLLRRLKQGKREKVLRGRKLDIKLN